MLRIENLTKTYGSKRAVDDLSFSIPGGEICAFIGHNGAGKTTTIKSVCGTMRFDSGDIFIDDISIKKDPIACKSLTAYIPDSPEVYEFLTGIKFLNFVADIYSIPPEARESRIHKYSDMFELTGDLAQPVGAYSHGMKQKLTIISALIHQPRLMVLDEPFVGLDPKASRTLKDLMREVCNNGGAIFFSTHILEVAEKLCDRVVIIKSGKLVASGYMDEVKGDSSLESIFFELAEPEESA